MTASNRRATTSNQNTPRRIKRSAHRSHEAETITKVVLVRPMAVTHQTDTEQKVIEMANRHDHANPSQIQVTVPNGLHPHSMAQKGYYMMFAVNAEGVPSEGKWIYLH